MEEAIVREHVAAHARALQNGDVERAATHLDDGFGARWNAILAQLPLNIHYVELTQVERLERAVVALVRFSGDAVVTTVEQRWEARCGRPTIIEARVQSRSHESLPAP
jgi:hypothetical protein